MKFIKRNRERVVLVLLISLFVGILLGISYDSKSTIEGLNGEYTEIDDVDDKRAGGVFGLISIIWRWFLRIFGLNNILGSSPIGICAPVEGLQIPMKVEDANAILLDLGGKDEKIPGDALTNLPRMKTSRWSISIWVRYAGISYPFIFQTWAASLISRHFVPDESVANQWHNIIWTQNDRGMKIYINGERPKISRDDPFDHEFLDLKAVLKPFGREAGILLKKNAPLDPKRVVLEGENENVWIANLKVCENRILSDEAVKIFYKREKEKFQFGHDNKCILGELIKENRYWINDKCQKIGIACRRVVDQPMVLSSNIENTKNFVDVSSEELTGKTGKQSDSGMWTIALWIKSGESTGKWRNVFRRGGSVKLESGEERRHPALFFPPDKMNLYARISTENSWNEGIDTTVFAAPANEWFHFVWVQDGQTMKLYFNGTFQQQFVLKGNPLNLAGPMQIPSIEAADEGDTDLDLGLSVAKFTFCPDTILNDQIIHQLYNSEKNQFRPS